MIKKDIGVIGSDYKQGSFHLLSCSYDRARASLHFASESGRLAEEKQIMYARWFCRASLSEFKSIFDVIEADFRELTLDKIWKRSQFKTNINSNPLIKVLKKARDLAIHTSQIEGQHSEIIVRYLDQEGEHPKPLNCIFFEKINRSMDQSGLEGILDEDMEWFNKQSKQWPINLLIQHAIYESSIEIANFFTLNIQYARTTR